MMEDLTADFYIECMLIWLSQTYFDSLSKLFADDHKIPNHNP